MKSKKEVERQLGVARNEQTRELSSRTKGYVEALEWVLEIER